MPLSGSWFSVTQIISDGSGFGAAWHLNEVEILVSELSWSWGRAVGWERELGRRP
jgi:hypothetical protein